MMFWHIVRKDWKLIWPLALIGGASNALLTVLRYQSSTDHGNDALAAVLTLGLVVVIVLLIVVAVQQDAIPGVNQDWLVRPIDRRDLLLAKLLLVALVVHGPMVVFNVMLSLAEGFPLGQSLRVAVLSTLEVALVFTLPTMAVASLARNLTEAVLGTVLVLFAVLITYWFISHAFHFGYAAEGTGVRWVWSLLGHSLLLLMTLAALFLQYFTRRTLTSRAVFVAGLFLFMLVPGLPWRPAFAIQRLLSADPAAARDVELAFDPTVSEPARVLLTDSTDDDEENAKSEAKDTQSIIVPLRVTGIPAGTVLHADRAVVRLVDLTGRTVYRGTGGEFDLISAKSNAARNEADRDAGSGVREVIEIPAAIYRRAAASRLRMEVDYSLTLLTPHTLPPFAALDGQSALPGVGHCTSAADANSTNIEVSCRALGEIPCIALHLSGDAQDKPDHFACDLDYQPAALRFSEDPIDHVKVKLPYRTPPGSLGHSVDAEQIHGAQVLLDVYEASAHFSRHLVVPDFLMENSRQP